MTTPHGRPAAAQRHAATARVETLLASARCEVLLMTRLSTREPLGAVRRVDHENLRRGVRYRLLVPDTARTEPVLATRLGALAMAGANTRTVPEVPAEALVVDGSAVVLPVDAAGAAVFHLPSVVATTAELFDRVWPTAVPLTASDPPDTAELGPREKELLSLLSTGCTDETAATRLDVSVRTVRRMVADIMNRLGARSRFQAGVKAADRGWLTEHPCR